MNEASDEHARLAHSSKQSSVDFERAEKEFKEAEAAFRQAEGGRKEADQQASVRRADFDYYNNLLHLEQLEERKERIDTARKTAARAEETISNNKTTKRALNGINQAERELLTVKAKLEAGAPSVVLRGLAQCEITIDDDSSLIESGEARTLAVPERLRVSIPERLEIEIVAGSSTETLSRQVADAQAALDAACQAAGVADPESARSAYEAFQQASREIDNKERIEKENLRDLSYDELADKVVRLSETVPAYLASRGDGLAIAPDIEAAKAAWEQAGEEKQAWEAKAEDARSDLESAREVRDRWNTKNSELRIELQSVENQLKQSQAKLARARESMPDESLEQAVTKAAQAVANESEAVETAQAELKARNPEQTKALAETAKSSLDTKQLRRDAAQNELTEVRTRLKFHGEEGLHEQLHAAKTALESATSKPCATNVTKPVRPMSRRSRKRSSGSAAWCSTRRFKSRSATICRSSAARTGESPCRSIPSAAEPENSCR